jgi:hypothetical protein
MRIPLTSIQAASISAIPLQANREARSASAGTAADPGQIELKANEILEKSVETGDRDAQERYQGKTQDSAKADEKAPDSSQPIDQESNSIWSLSVADDQPPPDLDIRG